MPKQDIAIIKVGKESTLRLRGIRTYRAVTVRELISIQESDEYNVRLIVIEKITEDEYNLLCDFARRLKGSDIQIVFFCNANDEVTSGAADELDVDIFYNTDKETFYNTVGLKLNLTINPDIYEQAKANKDKFDFGGDDFVSGFDAFDQAVTAVKKASETSKNRETTPLELPDILSKADINEDFSDNDLGITEDESQITKKFTDTEHNENQEVSENYREADRTETEECNKLKDSLNEAVYKIRELEESNSKLNIDYSESKKKVEEAVNKINELNKIIKSLNSEKAILTAELTKVETLEIIEDPVQLAEYSSIKAELESLKSGESVSSQELQEVKSKLESATSQIAELETLRTSLEEQVNEYKSSINDYELAAEESKRSLSEAASKIENLEEQIIDIKNNNTDKEALENANNQIKVLTDSLSEANDKIKELIYKVNNGANNRIVLMDMVKKAVEQLAIFENVISGQRDDINKLREQNYQLGNQLQEVENDRDTIREQLDNSSSSMEMAVQNHQIELDKAHNDNIVLQSQVELLRGQLIAKESQYNELLNSSGIDQNGNNTYESKNTALEEVNRALRSELSKAQKDVSDLTREKGTMQESLQRLVEDNRILKQKMGALSAGLTGNGVGGLIGKLNTSGRGLVIPVLGSGSYGITTSAVSLAYYLSMNSKVVFIDMDLISAKSDSWFGMPLIQTMVGIPESSRRSTGLGVFFDKGFSYFSQNYDKLILRKVKTKGGCIDYIGGLYFKLDALKMASADFTGLITLCKNNYDYVIIDCGRLGASDLNDQLTKAMADVAYKVVAVTPSEFIEVRNFRNLLQEEHIDITKIAWLLNMCRNTKINDKMRSMLTATKYAQVPYMDNLFEITDNGYKKKHFMQERLSKDKFGYFVNSCIFNK